MADEVKSAEADVQNESELVLDPKNSKTESSPDISGYSNTSRYGRARKPKITEDFYNIEDIFGPYERITSSSPRRKPHKLELLPNIDEDVSKVMKIVSNNDFAPKSPPFPSKSVKTYANKHKKILESHEYKVNGSKTSESNHKSEIYKNVRLFSDDSFDSKPVLHRTKPNKSVTEEITRDFDTTDEDFSEDFAKLAKNNKKINKLQRDLNITEFKTGRLRSSIAERSSTEDELEPEPETELQPEPQPEIKTEIVDEVSNAYSPVVGELSWSRVGTYPFWPSIVTNEPGFERHSRVVMFGRKYVKCYHVNFFGDNGRRSWVLATHIFPFTRRSDLEIMAQNVSKDSKPKDPKHLSAFIINPNKLKKWETAVTEAESITDFSPKTRIEKFFEMVSPKKKAVKRPLPSPKSGKVAYKKIKLEKKAKKLKKNKKNKSDEENIQKSPSPSIKEESEDRPVKNKIKNPKNKLEPDKPSEKKKPKPSEDPKSDESSSESDLVVIKEETRDTPSPSPQISSIQRQKRINLFRGITKERVCQICGKNKHVYKCKGNCFGLYHIECDKKVRLKVLSKLSEEKMANSDDSDEEKAKKGHNNRNSDIAAILDNIFDRVFDVVDGLVKTEVEIDENLAQNGPKLSKLEDHPSKLPDNHEKRSKSVEIPNKNEDKCSKMDQKSPNNSKLAKNHEKRSKSVEALNKNDERSSKMDQKASKSEDNSKLEDNHSKLKVNQGKRAKSVEVPNKNGGQKSSKLKDNQVKRSKSVEPTEPIELLAVKPDKTEDKSSKTLKRLKDTSSKCLDGPENPPKSSENPKLGQKEEVGSKKMVQDLSKAENSQEASASLSLAEQIDLKMAEVMQNLITETKYTDSTTDEGSEAEELTDSIVIDPFKKELEEYSHLPAIDDDKKVKKIIKHVTADGIFDIIEEEEPTNEDFKCAYCSTGLQQPCFICGKDISKSGDDKRHKCFTAQCGKYFHSECLKDWPQTKWNVSSKSKKIENETLSCPYHNCHTCISDNPRGPLSRYTNEKLSKCIRCPTTYHSTNFCIPAGTFILSTYQLICPKHLTPPEDEDVSSSPRSIDSRSSKKSSKSKIMPHMNASWCFICSMGGSLICCETCPSAFHVECLKLVPPEGKYLCEECESGRLPLYDEIVWVKLGAYRWWPAQILYPADVPPNVASIPHTIGEFVVRFFGSHDHYWVNRGRVFLFQEGDTGHASSKKSAVDGLFVKAIEEATKAHKKFIDERANRAAEAQNGMRPPAYIKIKVNRPVGNVRTNDADTSNTTPCDCDPNWEKPCGPDSDCLNRILMTECNPMVCAAGSRCCNQSFEKRLYAPVAPFKTTGRGWGLKTLAPVSKGSFVIEYVGEVIDEMEYQRRMKRKHEQKDENYYFLTIDKDRMIDAGPKGNVARFMNHSCSPNCETQKWTINGDTRVGLFAITDIPTDAELTFNYNLECIGEEKKECRCGAPNCSGFIGVKAKQDEAPKKRKSVPLKSKKKKSLVPEVKLTEVITCFVCGGPDAIQSCDRESCNKFYHLQCVSLENYQEGKWLCPWHSCNICAKRTSRCCYICINSYCPLHSEGNIRYKRNIGFVCTTHDIKEEEDPDTFSEDPKTKDLSKPKKAKKTIRSSTDSNKISEEILEPKEEPKSSSESSSRRSSKSDEVDVKEIKEDKPKKTGKMSKINEDSLTNSKPTTKPLKDQITIQNGAVISEISRPNLEESGNISSSDEIIQIDIVVSTKTPNNINSSIKKRKSRLSLKQSTESSSSQDSEDEKPLVTLKKLKISEETPPKTLRSSKSSSQEDLTVVNLTKTPNKSIELDSSSSESDFRVKKILKKKTKKVQQNPEPKKLRSSMNIEEKDPKMKTSTPKVPEKAKKAKLNTSKLEDLNLSRDDVKSPKPTPKKSNLSLKKPETPQPKPENRRLTRNLAQKSDESSNEDLEGPNLSQKRKRGRPRKYPKVKPTPKVEPPQPSHETTPKDKHPKVKTTPKVEPSQPSPPTPKDKRPKGRPKKHLEGPVSEPQKAPQASTPKPFDTQVKEVKLTANVPERHLRVVLRKTEIDQKIDNKFLKMQNDIERDLPIRKRSKLRYEAQL